LKLLEEALTKLKGTAGGETLGLYFPRPGVVATEVRQIEMPKNLSISITRSGDEPAKVHVKRDDKEWDTTADKLNELPEDVRQQVEQLLGKTIRPMMEARARAVVRGPINARLPMAPPPGVSGVPPTAAIPLPPPRVIVTPTAPEAANARIHAYRVEKSAEAGDVAGKLELIIKKLDNLESKAIEQLQDEVKELRKELDALRNK
jgi:hypothetical protein